MISNILQYHPHQRHCHKYTVQMNLLLQVNLYSSKQQLARKEAELTTAEETFKSEQQQIRHTYYNT